MASLSGVPCMLVVLAIRGRGGGIQFMTFLWFRLWPQRFWQIVIAAPITKRSSYFLLVYHVSAGVPQCCVPLLVDLRFPLSSACGAFSARSSQQSDCNSSDLQSHRPNFKHLHSLIMAMSGRSCQIIAELFWTLYCTSLRLVLSQPAV